MVAHIRRWVEKLTQWRQDEEDRKQTKYEDNEDGVDEMGKKFTMEYRQVDEAKIRELLVAGNNAGGTGKQVVVRTDDITPEGGECREGGVRGMGIETLCDMQHRKKRG